MDDNSSNGAGQDGGERHPRSLFETLEADVFDDIDEQKGSSDSEGSEPRQSDAAVTAEFDYISMESEAEEVEEQGPDAAPAAGINPNRGPQRKSPPPSPNEGQDGPITRALNDFDAYLDAQNDGGSEFAGPRPQGGPDLSRSEVNRGASGFDGGSSGAGGAWGYDQPQVSGVFSRYDEETRESDSDEFDLFEEDESEQQRERTLQDIVNGHEKQMRRLKKQLAYQKEVIQVVSELLVEARVISKRELKKRLRALRKKDSK